MSRSHPILRFVVIGLLAGLASACAASRDASSTAKATAEPSVTPRCEKREVTGSRLARCDDKEVRVISGEEIRNTGMPSAGAGRGAETR